MPSPPTPPPLPKRPYLLRALHQWIIDSGQTPHVVVDAAQEGVQVPVQFVENGRIVLNVSYSATKRLELSNDGISFDARFSGTPHHIHIPMRAVLGIYARESGEGLVFPTDDYGEPPEGPGPDTSPPVPTGKPSLKIVK